jgi:Ni/Co efflux regulator RcnB
MQMKRILGILLALCFLMSVTVAAAGAEPWQKEGKKDKDKKDKDERDKRDKDKKDKDKRDKDKKDKDERDKRDKDKKDKDKKDKDKKEGRELPYTPRSGTEHFGH